MAHMGDRGIYRAYGSPQLAVLLGIPSLRIIGRLIKGNYHMHAVMYVNKFRD